MNPIDVLNAAQRLQQQGQPYALVSVLRVQPPASARPGDKAVVTADGIVQGWIGGGCAQPAVLKTVRLALADGQARVIRIAPADVSPHGQSAAGPAPFGDATAGGGPASALDGPLRAMLDDVLEFGMACHSGGTLELFVDPMLPAARLVIVGDTPLAAALAGLAPRVGLPVTVIAHGADAARFPDAERVIASDAPGADVPPGAFAVVATQGRRDLQGLRAALSLRARAVFFVASARKAQVLKASLVEAGDDAAAVNAIVSPAGQPIGAQTPEEIALSVLAAVVAARRAGGPAPTRAAAAAAATPAGETAAAAAVAQPAEAQAPALATALSPATATATATAAATPAATGNCCGGAAKAAPIPASTPAPAAGPSSCCGG
jgi:xanthine dehydrogenase accessory factor